MVFIVVYVTHGSLRDAIDVFRCWRFYATHKCPVLLFQKLNYKCKLQNTPSPSHGRIVFNLQISTMEILNFFNLQIRGHSSVT